MRKWVKILLAVLGVLVIAAAVAGYGIVRAASARQYGSVVHAEITKILTAFKAAEDQQATALDPSALLKVSKEAADARKRIEGMKVPPGVGHLPRDSKSLLGHISRTSGAMARVIEYAADLRSASAALNTGIRKPATDMKVFAAVVGQMERSARDAHRKLSLAEPPPSFGDFNERMISLLRRYGDTLAIIESAAESQDYTAIVRGTRELSAIQGRFRRLDVPATRDLLEDIFPLPTRRAVQRLAGRVDAELKAISARSTLY